MTSFQVVSRIPSSSCGRTWPAKSIYIDNVKVGPTWVACPGDMKYWVSPAVRKVLAWSRRDGETVDGKFVDRLAPDVVIARLIRGTASSSRFRSFSISRIMSLISASFWLPDQDESFWAAFREVSSADAALARRCPRDWMSHLIDFVSETADSREVFPRAALLLD